MPEDTMPVARLTLALGATRTSHTADVTQAQLDAVIAAVSELAPPDPDQVVEFVIVDVPVTERRQVPAGSPQAQAGAAVLTTASPPGEHNPVTEAGAPVGTSDPKPDPTPVEGSGTPFQQSASEPAPVDGASEAAPAAPAEVAPTE